MLILWGKSCEDTGAQWITSFTTVVKEVLAGGYILHNKTCDATPSPIAVEYGHKSLQYHTLLCGGMGGDTKGGFHAAQARKELNQAIVIVQSWGTAGLYYDMDGGRACALYGGWSQVVGQCGAWGQWSRHGGKCVGGGWEWGWGGVG